MPRKQRTVKPRREIELTDAELERRAKWGGLLPGVPALTPEQRGEWQMLREASATWHPQATLHFCWANVDPVHGAGAWSEAGFMTARDADRAEIERVVTEHPEQADRLHTWLRNVQDLGHRREHDTALSAGDYYTQLTALGYEANAFRFHDDDEEGAHHDGHV